MEKFDSIRFHLPWFFSTSQLIWIVSPGSLLSPNEIVNLVHFILPELSSLAASCKYHKQICSHSDVFLHAVKFYIFLSFFSLFNTLPTFSVFFIRATWWVMADLIAPLLVEFIFLFNSPTLQMLPKPINQVACFGVYFCHNFPASRSRLGDDCSFVCWSPWSEWNTILRQIVHQKCDNLNRKRVSIGLELCTDESVLHRIRLLSSVKGGTPCTTRCCKCY